MTTTEQVASFLTHAELQRQEGLIAANQLTEFHTRMAESYRRMVERHLELAKQFRNTAAFLNDNTENTSHGN